MQTVTFVRAYRHPLPGHREARYLPGKISVPHDVAEAAMKAGAISSAATSKKAEPDGE